MLLFLDGCDNYSAAADLIKKWDVNTDPAAVTFNASAGRFGGGCIHFVGNTGHLTKNLPNITTGVTGFWHKVGTAGAMQSDYLCKFMQSGAGSAYGVFIKIEADGAITIFANDDPVAKVTSANKLIANIGYMIEVKAVCSDSGLVEVHVNGQEWASYSGDTYVGLTGASFGAFQLHGQGLADSYFDDLYLLDSTGSINPGNRLGDMRIETLSVNADSAMSQQWAPKTGPSLYTEIDELDSGDEDTSYISAGASGNRSRFELANLSAVPSFIAGIQINSRAKKTDAGSRDYRVYLDSNGVEQNGATHALATDYLSHQDIIEADPNTSLAFTQSGIDALEVGVEIVT